MADPLDKLTAMVTVEPWPDPGGADLPDPGGADLPDPGGADLPDPGGADLPDSDGDGYLVRALVRHGEIARYVVGPILVMTIEELRHQLIEICDLLMTMI